MKSFIFYGIFFSIQLAYGNVQSLVPPGYELAKTYAEQGEYPHINASKGSVIEFDFNKDGRKDFAILVEKRVCDGIIKGTACVNDYWGWSAEDRTLLVYFATQNGHSLVLRTQNGIMGDGDGGVANRDPLMSFEVSSKGTVSLSYWGGSSTKWGADYKVQFRREKTGADFYVIGLTTMNQDWVWGADNEAKDIQTTIEDRNLITGDKIITRFLMSDDSKETVVKTKELKRPLVKLSQADDLINW